jgi:hypothetical protein
MRRLSVQVPALTAAWLITKTGGSRARHPSPARLVRRQGNAHEPQPAVLAGDHRQGDRRSIGVIDTLHLVEVARAAGGAGGHRRAGRTDRDGVRKWFRDYLTWMNTHPYGTKERDAENNHGTCWVMQAAEFARYVATRRSPRTAASATRSAAAETDGPDGSFPRELRRTKPYGYSLFNLDVMTTSCQILSTPRTICGRSSCPTAAASRRGWSSCTRSSSTRASGRTSQTSCTGTNGRFRHASLLLAGLALEKPEYVALWKKLPAELKVDEVIRNVPVRQPLLWVNPARKA